MGYNKDKKPPFVLPLLNEYRDIEFVDCAADGSWARIRVNGDKVKLRIEIDNRITVSGKYKGKIHSVPDKKYTNVEQENKLVGEKMMKHLSGYESGEEAFKDNF